ncbi:MAG: hypothetical protein KL863_00480 [Rhizobium sp.]|nr:hypothetical protein [Rhizobium sp.]
MIDILRLSIPITVWLATFSAIYGLHGLLCSDRWSAPAASGGQTILIGAWAFSIVAQAGMLFALGNSRMASPSPLTRRISVGLAVVALVANLWTLFPVVATSHCL